MPCLLRKPSAALAPFVSVLWYYEGEQLAHARELALPDGRMQLLINLHEDALRWWDGEGPSRCHATQGAAVAGTYDRPIVIETRDQRRIVGVSFRCAGAAPVLGVASDAVTGSHVALGDLWGATGAVLRERLLSAPSPTVMLQTLDAALVQRVLRSSPTALTRASEMAVAAAALDAGHSVPAVAAKIGVSERQLRRHFATCVGLTPKRYARISRFQRALLLAVTEPSERWDQRALALGYYDQAHLIADFRALSWRTPTNYQPRNPQERNHIILS